MTEDAAVRPPARCSRGGRTATADPRSSAWRRCPFPRPGDGEVLLRVRATGAQLRRRQGHARRAAARAPRRSAAPTAHGDARDGCRRHGRRARPGVDDVAVGDEVMGELPGGALAEYVAAPAARLAARPRRSIRRCGGPAGRRRHGVAGARRRERQSRRPRARDRRIRRRRHVRGAARGAPRRRGLGAVRRAQRAIVGDLGAVRTFDYRRRCRGRPARRVVRRRHRHRRHRAAARAAAARPPGGTVVLVSGEGGRVVGPIGRILARHPALAHARTARSVRSPRPRSRRSRASSPRSPRAGGIRPSIERTWPFAEARAALAHVDGRSHRRQGRRHRLIACASAVPDGPLATTVREWMPACPSRPLHPRFLSERSESKGRRAPGQRPPPLPEEQNVHAEHRARRPPDRRRARPDRSHPAAPLAT